MLRLRASFLLRCNATFWAAMANPVAAASWSKIMVWLDSRDGLNAARERAETALYAPIGMMSPLWLLFGAAASAGAAFWLMTRLVRPVNVEAMMAPPKESMIPVTPMVEAAKGDVPVEATAQVAAEEPATPPIDEALEAAERADDDLTRLIGVGPKIAKALAERGVVRFEQLAAWSEQELMAFDAALDLRGKAIRAGFVEQARKLAHDEG
jgi:predicted flap endonuclease-1-like 5' DNA nuclease